jgi:adenosine kinase
MTKHWGGVAANITYSMALLGLRPRLMGTVGRDFGDYRAWLEGNGVDTSTVRQFEDVFTSSFFANTDLDNNQIASFYAGAMSYAKTYSLAEAGVTKADLVLNSPNDPQAMLNLSEECRQNGIPFVFDPSQQVPRLTGDDLRAGMQGAHIMLCNAYEAEVIGMKTGMSIDEMRKAIDILVVTNGKRGSHIYDHGELIDVPVFPLDHSLILDPTGSGDAYRAGFIRGIAAGLPLKLAAEMGSLCAVYVLERVGTQNHHFTPEEFIARFRTQFDDQGQLDVLLPSNAEAKV